MAETPKICVFTGSRADYGLLRGLLRELQQRDALRLLVSGMHLSAAFGMTRNEILADGFAIDAEVDMELAGDDPAAIAKALGRGVIGMTDALQAMAPDVLVILGDRYEALAAAQVALLLSIPIAHIHGGEITEGALDDAIRHAISKMATLHFPAAEPYRRRLIQMGEDPARVHDVGALGIQNTDAYTRIDRAAFSAKTGFSFGPLNILATCHPVTATGSDPEAGIAALCAALDRIGDCRILFTAANADAGGRRINAFIEAYAKTRPQRAQMVASLGSELYAAALGLFDLVVGNSSSGLIEAPAAGTPTVNIGDRQKGRLRAPSVIDCAEDAAAIEQAIRSALTPEHRRIAEARQSPYGRGATARLIAEALLQFRWREAGAKRFHDLQI
ncbi:UDP-N-acetylglucosamine 2-epimerase [Ferrovibrio sp.]|uniref:UDP-N-acetylglucosamine 2-epimerase n=1 Tax=Ferrovibrio sp. TaxID=1917215 RepID=UPI0026319BBD|nr:UDP-N-acetylglucosamine 2-epimerase [Ferrovibrio sp.]